MKKLLTILLVLITAQSFAQEQGVYQKLPIYGAQYKRLKADSALHIPTFCSVPTLLSVVGNQSAIAFDSCGHKFYVYDPKDSTWSIANQSFIDSLLSGYYTKGQIDSMVFSGVDSTAYHTIGQASDSSYFTINTPDGRVDTVRFVGGSSGGITQSQLDDSTAAIRNDLTRPYKVYCALLTQTGTNAPSATILENTTGFTFTFSRTSVGTYFATASGTVNDAHHIVVGFFSPPVNLTPVFIRSSNYGATALRFDTYQMSDQTHVDGYLFQTFIEIRLYTF